LPKQRGIYEKAVSGIDRHGTAYYVEKNRFFLLKRSMVKKLSEIKRKIFTKTSVAAS
jgi:hypothetical protein